MGHLALEVFDLPTNENPKPTGSKYAVLSENASITITDTSEIFGSGDVWSFPFKLNVNANAHIFGTAGETHGSRLHEQIDKRRARLWVDGLPLYLGYLKLGDEADVDASGDVDVSLEAGRKTFDEMIEGASARDVSVGDVVIGVALNRKRVITISDINVKFRLKNLPIDDDYVRNNVEGYIFEHSAGDYEYRSALSHRWPKLVLSKGELTDYTSGTGVPVSFNKTNIQNPYDDSHPFCNVNVCYQRKRQNADLSETTLRDYVMRLAYGNDTTTGGDGQTRFNNAPNFYLLYWLKRLFMDLHIQVVENQMLNVEDFRHVFLANLGCFYEEMDNDNDTTDNYSQDSAEWKRYGKYSFPDSFILDPDKIFADEPGKIYVNSIDIESDMLTEHSFHGTYHGQTGEVTEVTQTIRTEPINGYLAYATGENYPNVEISEIIEATESAFGVRFLFNNDFSEVRIVLIRNILTNRAVKDLGCDIIEETKIENNIRGFKMTYGQGKGNVSYFYKGFDDMLPKKKVIWKDKSDKHDYSNWNLTANYNDVINNVTAFDKTCYVTPDNGNAYGIMIDEKEDVFFPAVFEFAGFMDACDGDCTEEGTTIDTKTINATPLIPNNINGDYAVFFNGEMKAPGGKHEVAAMIPIKSIEVIHGYARIYKGTDPSGWVSSWDGYYLDLKNVEIYVKEGYSLSLMDNYSFTGNEGTPFDNADLGLSFGVMRRDGRNSSIISYEDLIEGEGNFNWEVSPDGGAIIHPDTCDSYGNEWYYHPEESATTLTVTSREDAVRLLEKMFPRRNAQFYTPERGYITSCNTHELYDYDANRAFYAITAWYQYYPVTDQDMADWAWEITMLTKDMPFFAIGSIEAAYEEDRKRCNILLDCGYDVDISPGRIKTIEDLFRKAYGPDSQEEHPIIIDNGISARYGRFSLKLRAEKPNPYFDPSLPDIISTKDAAGRAMKSIFITANTDLLSRPRISGAEMKAAGWNDFADGDYATLYSTSYSVYYDTGKVHEILFTPIREDGTVLSPSQLQNYAVGFNGLSAHSIAANDTQHLVLDIDTNDSRAEILHQLQAIYYAADGEIVPTVDIGNTRYLSITNPNLRNRGLCDQFYKEYSYLIRNGRICRKKVRMELAVLLSIDKTNLYCIGDITGYIRKIQYTVSNNTGLNDVTLDIIYI